MTLRGNNSRRAYLEEFALLLGAAISTHLSIITSSQKIELTSDK